MILTAKLFTFWLLSLSLHVGCEVNNTNDVIMEVDWWKSMISYRNSSQLSSKKLQDERGSEITSLSRLFEDPVAVNKKKCPYCRLRCATLRHSIQDELKYSVMNASSGLPLPAVKIASSKELDYELLRIELYNLRNVSAPAKCTLVIFYAPWCPWSAKAAPHLNAVSRAFKNIQFVGVDAYSSSSFDISNYGIYGVPSLLLFHNGRLHTRYNGSDITMHSVANLKRHTDQIPGEMEMKSVDFRGPLRSTPAPLSFYYRKELLMGSWLFILASALYYLLKWEVFFKLF
ncbi:Thioredoxin domain-containing protein 15 [Orchesella cincta]|uniref:Thioredoxin domain-containing protein 15 n=1 Tax=Orchesella cincta TaxID=48709 RepID=A0A1D2MRV1_ORCCI|nr:Thioredoxin domain-containing protein 15 [Orchesella cincta]